MSDDKFLDPQQNDFIRADPIDPDRKAIGDDGRAPFLDFAAEGVPDPVALARDIAAAYPGQNEIAIGDMTLTKMVSGNFTVDFVPLAELPLASLVTIREAVRLRRY